MPEKAAGKGAAKKGYTYVRKSFRFEGKKYSVRGKTEREAAKKLADRRRELSEGLKLKDGNVLVKDYVERYLEIHRKPALSKLACDCERSLYELHVFPRVGQLKMSKVTKDDLQLVLNKEAGGKSLSLAAKLRGAIKRAFSEAHEGRIIPFDPSAKLKIPKSARDKRRRALASAERAQILKACKGHKCGLWIRTLLFTGIRPQEAAALAWSDVDTDAGMISITKAAKAGGGIGGPKSEAGIRCVPVDGLLLRELREAKAAAESSAGRVFKGLRGQDLNRSKDWAGMWKSFKKSADRAMGGRMVDGPDGKKSWASAFPNDVTLYCLRHSCATHLHAQGVPDHVIQAIMGHSSFNVTERSYIDTMAEEMRAGHERVRELIRLEDGMA
jgi:integrase